MAVQPSLRPDRVSTFFADGRASRPDVPGTVARGHLQTDLHFFSGTGTAGSAKPAAAAALVGAGGNVFALADVAAAGGEAVENSGTALFPFPVTAGVLKHGQNRFMIYCVECHDTLGTGQGIVVQRGYTPPPSYHIDRLRKAPVGHFFQVVTRGYGSMPSYAAQVPPADRWAIIAYIRALQLSQHFPEKELSDDMRREREGAK